MHGKDIALLQTIKSFFGVGNIIIRNRDNQVIYPVKSLKQLNVVNIPIFLSILYLHKKRVDFELFKMFIEFMINKQHLTKERLRKIVSIRASLGKGLSTSLTNYFSDIVPIKRPIIKPADRFDNEWLTGFVSAED